MEESKIIEEIRKLGGGIAELDQRLSGGIAKLTTDVRHMGVLLEETRDEVHVIAEQYGDIKKTLDTHTEMIGDLTVRMTMVEGHIDAIEDHLNDMKKI